MQELFSIFFNFFLPRNLFWVYALVSRLENKCNTFFGFFSLIFLPRKIQFPHGTRFALHVRVDRPLPAGRTATERVAPTSYSPPCRLSTLWMAPNAFGGDANKCGFADSRIKLAPEY
jgi:hypothetical protein